MAVLVRERTGTLDRPLTYAAPPELGLRTGDVVRVPLGTRDVFGFVTAGPHDDADAPAALRPVLTKAQGLRAFDEDGLALARFVAEHYCCSLAEALGAVVYAPAMPRAVDRFLPGPAFGTEPPRSVPARLWMLIRDDLREGFTREALLRHPEARRAGDRRALVAALAALVRTQALVRRREFASARVVERTERVLLPAGGTASGRRAAALLRRVAEAGVLPRRDAVLEGFSAALIARATRAGALAEETRRTVAERRPLPPASAAFAATPEQRAAIDAIDRGVASATFFEALIQGVTGSGKTFVYLEIIRHVLASGGRAIILVPEIALTPQTARRFERVFGERVAVLHSGLSDRERFDAWEAASRGEVDVVVGARGAVFVPMPQLRMIVVDEAHERTYKQDGVPRYNAVDVARERMRAASGALVTGSATPPLDRYAAALAGEIVHLRLTVRATAAALPPVRVVDMAAEFERGNRRPFSSALVDALGARLEAGEKSVLFVNRRGSASFVLCRACGHVPTCDRCSLSLAAHRGEGLLRCHLCDRQRPLPERCPACGEPAIREFGAGTERVAEHVRRLFPAARIVRMDADTTTRTGDHARLLDAFEESGDILVGTQMVAKGLDFEAVTLVGVVAADIGLHAPDFRAAERTFDLLTQVAGRSGRSRPGEAIVQTYAPDHPAIRFASAHDFDGFAASELPLRRELGWPPYADLAYVGTAGRDREDALRVAERIAATLRGQPGFEVLGPAADPIARLADDWRFRIAVKTRRGAALRALLQGRIRPMANEERGSRVSINIDP